MTSDPVDTKATLVVGLVVPLAALLAVTVIQAQGRPSSQRRDPVLSGPVAAPTSGASLAGRADGGWTTTSRSGTRRPIVDPGWVSGTSRRTGIPLTAVRAYATATLALARQDPRCHLGWTTLAGIGEVESRHGTIGGRTLRADGRSSTAILGPALDGSRYAAIPASAFSYRLDGDPRWDHAVGPLQFIPSTWSRWASDGDGDGTADPHDIFDASYAAGRYLCAAGGDLTTPTGWTRAILSYNHSSAYVSEVLSAANWYGAR